MGARVLLHDGLIDECGAVAREIAAETGAFDVSTLQGALPRRGQEDDGARARRGPRLGAARRVVYPTGGGTGLVGMWKAFDELEALGFIGPERPRMVVRPGRGLRADRARVRGGERDAPSAGRARRRAPAACACPPPSATADPGRAAGVRRDRDRGQRGRADRGAGARRAADGRLRRAGERRRVRRRAGAARSAATAARASAWSCSTAGSARSTRRRRACCCERSSAADCGWVGERGSHPAGASRAGVDSD